MSFENERRKAQLRMAHGWGYCRTNNCELGFPQSTGMDWGRKAYNTDPQKVNCKDKVKS